MSATGLCAVCGEGNAEYTCDRCGSLVCERHYEPSLGYCVECAGEVGGGRQTNGNDQPENGDTYQF
ncbi:zinc finger HIT domain-containing protein [Halorhabdus rudnickae]|uniref:zinc finger HIT domain-containing protein n=1 Tax=Halorhabdus rudnickae TaxID=1775544 RepID=UPI0010828B43|nr:zinc finger HIT domain-containing protein [Halorhabdus rudnickae]